MQKFLNPKDADEGAALLFTELVSVEWDHGALKITGRTGGYTATGWLSVSYAMALHHQLGKALARVPNVVDLPKRRKKRKHG